VSKADLVEGIEKLRSNVDLSTRHGQGMADAYFAIEKFIDTLEAKDDSFIKKACKWLKNSTYGYLTEKWGETELDRETLAADFEKYMKG